MDLHIQITRRPTVFTCLTFTGQTNTVAVIHTRWHLDRQGLAFFYAALAVAVATGIGNGLALAMAMGTGLLYREKALLDTHLTGSTTGAAGDRRRAFFSTAAITGFTGHQGWNLDLYGGAGHRVFQPQLHIVTQVGTTERAAATTTTTENIAKYITENITEIGTTTAKTGTGRAIDTGMTILIIGRTLLCIREDIVGFSGFLELARSLQGYPDFGRGGASLPDV